MQAYVSQGYVAVAVDSRYHDERALNLTTYRDVRNFSFYHVVTLCYSDLSKLPTAINQ